MTTRGVTSTLRWRGGEHMLDAHMHPCWMRMHRLQHI